MGTPEYLYDDDPQPLHAGAGRSRQGLLLGLGAATVAVGVGMVVLLGPLTGSPEEQSQEVADVFSRALAAEDAETAWGLLCDDEQNRVAPDDLATDYLLPGTPTVVGVRDGELGDRDARVVEVRWDDGGVVTTAELTLVAENGPRVCGVSR